jgi:CO/xanthine dehydrogenase FAD-binding subunit
MYASPFDYATAPSWEEAVALLAEGGDEARVIAGGQSLVPMMTLRLATPHLLVDVNRASTATVEQRGGRLALPALTRHAELERSPLIRRTCPILAEAAAFIGNVRVRHRGTIGGSLAHADPAAELACVAVALGAEIRALGPAGERTIPAEDFFVTHFTSTLGPGEVVTSVEVPVIPEGGGWAFAELTRRAGDFALVEAAALVDLDDHGRCREVRLALGAVGERPVDVSELAAPMLGVEPDDRVAAEVGRSASGAVEPAPSVHGSAEYRREMVHAIVRRALVTAAGRAGISRAGAR